MYPIPVCTLILSWLWQKHPSVLVLVYLQIVLVVFPLTACIFTFVIALELATICSYYIQIVQKRSSV